jgi:NitT/TauT family transport system substrate-binding protein
MHGSNRTLRAVALVVLAVLALVASGCSKAAVDTSKPAVLAKPIAVRIGTLPTEDSLPLWVAEDEGLFAKAGLPNVEITIFQSAQERDTAMASGAIDAFMGDIIAAANLEAGGTPVTIATIMLGATSAEGRFGIAAPKDWTGGTGNEGLAKLAGVPVGTSSATIQEYVLDGLMRQAGVPADQVKKEEVKKVPIRFELLMQGKLKAAALPEPFLSLAELQGAKLVADDTTGENLSQTVLVFTDEYLRKTGGLESEQAVLKAWDEAVALINKDPNAYRAMLVDKARLPEPLKDTYEVNTYPTAQLPTQEQVDNVLTWMREKTYLKTDAVDYTNLTVVMPEK